MPQLDLPAYPTQLFWLTCLLTLLYLVLHSVAIPSILVTLRVRALSLLLVKTTIKNAYKRLQSNKTKYYTFVSSKIKIIALTCVRIRKVVISFLNHQELQLNSYTMPLRLIVNQPVVLSERQMPQDYATEFRLPDSVRQSITYYSFISPEIKSGPLLYHVAKSIRNKTLRDYRAPKKESRFTIWIKKIRAYMNLSLPFLPVIHPSDDFVLAVAFVCIFIFIIRKYGTTLGNLLTGSYATDIKAKFVLALTDISNNLNIAKQLLSNCINMNNNIRNTYQSMIKIFLIQDKYPVKLKSKDDDTQSN